MQTLIAGLLVFFAVHSISIVAPDWRNRVAAQIGQWPWKGLYSLLSIAGFVLIVVGYAQARGTPEVLYSLPGWTRHLAALLMLPVFILLLAAYLPGRIKAAVGHPMLLATVLWAVAHLLTTVTVTRALLFGSFLVWALLAWVSARRRVARAIPGAPASRWNDAIAIIVGLGAYLGFALWLHLRLIGLAPFGA